MYPYSFIKEQIKIIDFDYNLLQFDLGFNRGQIEINDFINFAFKIYWWR
jgi:hypothetical protein